MDTAKNEMPEGARLIFLYLNVHGRSSKHMIARGVSRSPSFVGQKLQWLRERGLASSERRGRSSCWTATVRNP